MCFCPLVAPSICKNHLFIHKITILVTQFVKAFFSTYFGSLYISKKWYLLVAGCAVLFFVTFFFTWLYLPVWSITFGIFLATVTDYALLYRKRGGVTAAVVAAPRFSLGDNNNVAITINNHYGFRLKCSLIHELPFQFQERDFLKVLVVPGRSSAGLQYALRPTSRGEYDFGMLWGFAATPIGFLQRRIPLAQPFTTKVYPSFQMMRKYMLLAANEYTLPGVKRVRRLGHSMEFEKIKDYVQGDDVRTINWKATARSSQLMVNIFTDTRQQQVYCLIDKGRSMKMPFDGLTLLDHSINASLAILNVALTKHDKAGIITFANKAGDIVAADRRNNQLHRLLEALYRQKTDFLESDYDSVWSTISTKITQRSLMLLFTNFESRASFDRQLPYIRKLAQNHLLVVVFFQNTLLEELHTTLPDNLEGIYIKTIADHFAMEKRLIVKELRRHGVLSILTTPENLSVDVINKYLELKARQMV